jgi:hypothetical protein
MYMKNTCLLIAVLVCNLAAQAQLKTTAACPGFNIDILRGRINETLNIKSTAGEFKSIFPCFTSAEDESAGAKCGGGVFFKDKDIYFYTGRDYIEIGEKFKGKLSVPLIGAPRNGMFKWLGNPYLKDTNFDVYQTAYGIIILYFNKANKVNKIQFSVEGVNTIKLCEN